MALDPVDVCIVGSGAGGAPLALELGRAGFKVVVLEKGPFYKKEDFVHDEVLNGRRNFFMPYPWEEPHLIRFSETAPFRQTNDAWTANCVGGGTVHMSGYFYRLKPMDFRLRSLLGNVPGADVVDWPITYQDLAPFYDQAEEELGVSGIVTPHPFAEPRSKPYPLPPLKAHPISNELDRVTRKMGLHPFVTTRGIISEDYRGRSGCAYCSMCGSYGCEVDAKSGANVALIPQAIHTGNVEVRPLCMAKQVEVDGRGLAKSVVYLDKDGVTQEQPAKIIIVSCTAVESARLLLNSKSQHFPHGLANANGRVGKGLVFSNFGESRATFRISKRKDSWPWLSDPSPFVLRSLQDYYLVSGQRFRKGGTMNFVFAHPNPIFAASRLAGSGKDTVFGKELKDKLRDYRDSKILLFESYIEWLSNPGSYVKVDDTVVDKFGIPVAQITAARHPLDYEAIKYITDRGDEILKAMEPDGFERFEERGVTTILQGGTCRFGNDPATSVLDKNCRAHEVKNLYVVDGSFMPTSGGITTTLTIVANSFRVAHHLVKEMKHA
jgi:choline dehydrogenase-like flavoprotein